MNFLLNFYGLEYRVWFIFTLVANACILFKTNLLFLIELDAYLGDYGYQMKHHI